MIARLSGTLVEKQPNQVVVDVGGVGYQVLVPLSTFMALGALEERVTLLVHTHLREDQLQLFGFLTARERRAFELLISVSGVGPALALKALSGMPVDELLPMIRRGEVERLVRIPGIGKKTAERVIVELRDRLSDETRESAPPAPAADLAAQITVALSGMGYDQRDIDAALKRIVRSGPRQGFDEVFRAALDDLTASRSVVRRQEREGGG